MISICSFTTSSLSPIDWIFSLKLCFSSRIAASTKELLGLMPLLVSLLTEEKHANGRLRADIKLKSQELKVQEEKVRATEEQRQNVLTRIINRLESIDGKWKTFSNKPPSASR
jgi:hypothetical protein